MSDIQRLSFAIRKIERGFVVEFMADKLGFMGDEYAALAPADLREVLDEQLQERITAMIAALMMGGDE